jgi:hypothetical protein
MTRHETARSRLLCRLARFWCAIGGAPRNPVARHLEHCAACRAFLAAGDHLEHLLRRDAARHAGEAPPGLERRIHWAVASSGAIAPRRSGSPSRTPARTGPLPTWVLGATAALAALAAGLFLLRPPTPSKPAEADLIQVSVALLTSLPGRLADTLPAPGTTLAPPNPLREFDAACADTRSALRFLALNFLPAAPPPPPRSAEADDTST